LKSVEDFIGRSIRLATEPLLKSVEVLKPLGVRLAHLPFKSFFNSVTI